MLAGRQPIPRARGTVLRAVMSGLACARPRSAGPCHLVFLMRVWTVLLLRTQAVTMNPGVSQRQGQSLRSEWLPPSPILLSVPGKPLAFEQYYRPPLTFFSAGIRMGEQRTRHLSFVPATGSDEDMNELLSLAIKAHGGLDRWNKVRSVEATASITGAIWYVKGRPDVLKNVVVSAETEWSAGSRPGKPGQRRDPAAGSVARPPCNRLRHPDQPRQRPGHLLDDYGVQLRAMAAV
jgi:hypothetical protein